MAINFDLSTLEYNILVDVVIDGSTTRRFSKTPVLLSNGTQYLGRLIRASEFRQSFGSQNQPVSQDSSITLTFNNRDDYFNSILDSEAWAGKTVKVWISQGNQSANRSLQFVGKIKVNDGIAQNDDELTIRVTDNLAVLRKTIPYRVFDIADTTSWPELEDDASGIRIPIVYGRYQNPQLVRAYAVDVTNKKFKVSDLPITGITTVYKSASGAAFASVAFTALTAADKRDGTFSLDGAVSYNENTDVIAVDMSGKGKELEAGTNTSVSAGKLVDTAATFSTSGVVANDIVWNATDQTLSLVTSVDSETQLTIGTDIFTATGKVYQVMDQSTMVEDDSDIIKDLLRCFAAAVDTDFVTSAFTTLLTDSGVSLRHVFTSATNLLEALQSIGFELGIDIRQVPDATNEKMQWSPLAFSPLIDPDATVLRTSDLQGAGSLLLTRTDPDQLTANKITVRYNESPVYNRFDSTYTAEDSNSQSDIGLHEVGPESPFSFSWNYVQADVETRVGRLLIIRAIPPKVTYVSVGARATEFSIGDKFILDSRRFSSITMRIMETIKSLLDIPSGVIRLVCQDFSGYGRVGRWMASTAPNYTTATDQEKVLSGFWCDANGRADSGDAASVGKSSWW